MRLFLPQREVVRPVGGLRSQRVPWAWWLRQRQRDRRWPEVTADPLPAPTAFWRLEEGAETVRNDSVGTLHLSEANYVYQMGGRMGYCAFFDYTSASGLYRNHHASLSHDNGDFSISCWFKMTENAYGQALVGKWASSFSGADDELLLYFDQASLALTAGIDGLTDGYNITGATMLNENQWYHGAATFSRANNRARIYVNGVLDAQLTNWTAALQGGGAEFCLGTESVVNQYYLHDGWMDGVGWFKGVELTPAQVAALATGIEYYGGQWNLVAPA